VNKPRIIFGGEKAIVKALLIWKLVECGTFFLELFLSNDISTPVDFCVMKKKDMTRFISLVCFGLQI